jgi:hypothetical protein
MRKWLAGCLALIFLISGIPVFAENTGKDTVSIQESMVSVEGESVGSLAENFRFLADLLKNEEIRSLLKMEDVSTIFTEVVWKVLVWMYENRPVTMKILTELGVDERGQRCIAVIWDSADRIAHEVDVFKASEEGRQLQEESNALLADPDFRKTLIGILNLTKSEDLSNLLKAVWKAAESAGTEATDSDGVLTAEAMKRKLGLNTYIGNTILNILKTLEESDWVRNSLPQLQANENLWNFLLHLASMDNSGLDNVIREEMEKLSQDPEISIFILETLTGLSGLSQAMMEAPETEEMPWEAGGEPVPDSTEEETAP